MEPFWIVAVIFCAAFTQSLTGFGSALVAMAVLPGLIGIRTAAPLVALMAITLESLLLVRHHTAFNLHAVWRLALASALAIPVGMLILRQLNEKLALAALGVVICAYALYALLNFKLPRLEHPMWAYGFGLLAGLLSGAYNTGGPPAVVFGNCQRWPPSEFKGNLQGFFLVNDVLVITSHALSGHVTATVLRDYLLALPAVAAGVLLGSWIDRYLDPIVFRRIVLVLLLLVGLRLLF